MLFQRLSNYFEIRKHAFNPIASHYYKPLNKLFGKKIIDRVYEEAFNRIFLMVKFFDLKGDIFEFGVFQGYSAKLLAMKMKNFSLTNCSLHLFDSFIGLPEQRGHDRDSYECSSGAWQKGKMHVSEGLEQYIGKKISKILAKEKVYVVKGFFEEVLENHFAKFRTIKAKVVHFDCDLYSSSKYVFDFLLKNEIIQDGTILIFDDWMTSLGNPNLGQRRAISEVLEKNPFWSCEKYFNFGTGSQVCIAHDLRITNGILTNP